jgi:hypothetical protein
MAAGPVGGEGLAVASLIKADANKRRSITSQDWHRDRDPARSNRAVKEYLDDGHPDAIPRSRA